MIILNLPSPQIHTCRAYILSHWIFEWLYFKNVRLVLVSDSGWIKASVRHLPCSYRIWSASIVPSDRSRGKCSSHFLFLYNCCFLCVLRKNIDLGWQHLSLGSKRQSQWLLWTVLSSINIFGLSSCLGNLSGIWTLLSIIQSYLLIIIMACYRFASFLYEIIKN